MSAVQRKAERSEPPFFISVVIVNYNGVPFLERCLSALVAQTYPRYEIILVDNGSTDDSCEFVRAHFPQVRLLRNEKNVGFAAGNNLGIRAARGDLIATLNTDTKVEREFLQALSEPMAEPRVGMCAPLMLEMERRDIVDAAGITVDRFGFGWNLGAGRPAREFTAPRPVFGACAGAGLYRRALFDEIGGFDEDYFAFYEDVDLAWRARLAGWKALLVPQARVYHYHGGSFGKISPQKLYLLARNRWWTILKNYPMPALVWHLPLMVWLDAAAALRAVLMYRSFEPLRGRWDAWRTRAQALEKRRALQAKIRGRGG